MFYEDAAGQQEEYTARKHDIILRPGKKKRALGCHAQERPGQRKQVCPAYFFGKKKQDASDNGDVEQICHPQGENIGYTCAFEDEKLYKGSQGAMIKVPEKREPCVPCNLRKVIYAWKSAYRRDIIRVYRIIVHAGEGDALCACQIGAEENEKNSCKALSVAGKKVFYLCRHGVFLIAQGFKR